MLSLFLVVHTATGSTKIEIDSADSVNTIADRLALAGYVLVEFFDADGPKKRWIAGAPGEYFVQLNVQAAGRPPHWVVDRKVARP